MSTASPSILRIVLFGLGRAGRIHLRNLHARADTEVCAVVEMPDGPALPPEDCALMSAVTERVDATDAAAVNALLSRVDTHAVVLASPTRTHADLTMRALHRGCHVLVEKPLAESLADIHACFDAAEAAGLVLSVGYNRRYDPAIRALKQQVDTGAIGEPRTVLTISRDYPYPPAAFLATCGGLFHDCATHDIDYVSWILNDTVVAVHVTVPGVCSATDSTMTQTGLNVDHAVVQLKFDQGAVATLHLSRVASSYDQRCEVFGDQGEARMATFEPGVKRSFPERYAAAFEAELDAFVQCVRTGTHALVTREDCVAANLVAEACGQSLVSGGWVPLETAPTPTFRQYNTAPARVKANYRTARERQTVAFVDRMLATYAPLDRKMGVWAMLEELNDLVDVSDPDLSHPNIHHAFQTAEAIRAAGLPDWMQLTGLLHDVGKIMYLRGCDADGTSRDQQWAMVGDTFVVGCALPDSLVYPEFNALHPDRDDPRYNTPCGRYTPGCGMDQVQCSWGHDEYLYRILASPKNPHTLPEEALYIVRFHSLYAYHRDGAYRELMDDKDRRLLPVLQQFNQYDLYSKSDTLLDIEVLRPYYAGLMETYLGRGWWWV